MWKMQTLIWQSSKFAPISPQLPFTTWHRHEPALEAVLKLGLDTFTLTYFSVSITKGIFLMNGNQGSFSTRNTHLWVFYQIHAGECHWALEVINITVFKEWSLMINAPWHSKKQNGKINQSLPSLFLLSLSLTSFDLSFSVIMSPFLVNRVIFIIRLMFL